ncbi:MAG TPA: hypothetical protein DGR08_05800 [Synechococcales bacterium UBA12195]|nr:hypothetical protein [Synechococcus sp.]OUW40216.1 MAG: hypothetical protein CBD45_04855 [Synechococcus sp. TMED185]RCL62843.1 MAG: hypothetical protein DBW81_04120 [Synechococcus sp. MED-G67]HCV57085.1 hypothetical protein [Synechococcales bacterium UBA12195]
MSARPCCRSCRHCHPAADSSWCRLRRVMLHPDLTADLSCHHWTAKPPELPDWGHHEHQGVKPADSQQLRLSGLTAPRG